MKRIVTSLSVLSLLLVVAPVRADDTGVWKAFKGKILVSDQPFESSYPSDGAMISAYKKQQRASIEGANGNWTLNMMVFLSEPPGAPQIYIAYYDVSGKKPEQVNYSEIAVETTQKSVQLNSTAISKEVGFVAGHKIEIRATRLIAGKEKVFAKTTITLK